MPIARWALLIVGLLAGHCTRGRGAVPDEFGSGNGAFIVDVWDTERGLPQNEVTALLQTQDGHLWFGTPNGLVRFDGVRFTTFDESNTPGLRSSRILSLFEDRAGNLWIDTESGGVAKFRDGQATPVDVGQGRLAAVCEDREGAVWLYNSNGQLWQFQTGQTNTYTVGADSPSQYRGMFVDAGGSVWIAADTSLTPIQPKPAPKGSPATGKPVQWEIKTDLVLASEHGGFWRLSGQRVTKWKAGETSPELVWDWYPWGMAPISGACEDRQGHLIVATQGAGLFWYDDQGQATRITTKNGLSSNYLLSVHVDQEGSLWVGTDGGGLNRVKRSIFQVLEDSRNLVVQSVHSDRSGGLWIGYSGSTPANYWKAGELQVFSQPFGRIVRTVFVDSQQRVWGGTTGAGLLRFEQGQFRPLAGTESISRFILAFYEDRQGRIWVGTKHGLARWDEKEWRIFTTRDGLSSDVVQAITADPEGNLWIGTEGGGLNRLRDNQFVAFRKSDTELPSDNISSLYVDREGVLWIGTNGGGLCRLDRGQWTRYSRREGLVSNSIGYLLEDLQGYLWIGSNAGLMRIAKRNLNDLAKSRTNLVACRVYGKPDGLPTRECTSGSQPAACQTPDGRFWFATIKGLVSIDPARLRPNPHPPPVAIESFLVDGQPERIPSRLEIPDRPIRIPASKEHLEIQYSSLNLTAPERARFKYRLEGHETGWTEVGDTRVAHYIKLAPGTYHFQVTACNEDGLWNDTGATLAFMVQPPIWQEPWFLGSLSVLLLVSGAALIHTISTQKLQRQLVLLKQQEALEKERSRIARDIHDQLGASLTQVALLGELVESDKDAPAEVEEHARQISQTARETTRVLDEIVWAVNPSNDTLDGLITYICKYAQEYLAVAGLTCRFHVPDQLPPAVLPPEVRHNVFLVCKEAVTNIVRHAKASEAQVELHLAAETFTIQISDNGRGLTGMDEQAAQMRNGLRNMRKRMESVGGDFAIGPGRESGTRVRLTAPLLPRRN